MAKIIIKTEVEGLEQWEEPLKDAMNQVIKFTKAKERAEEGIAFAKQSLAVIFKLLKIEDGLVTKGQGKFTYVGPGITKSFSKVDCKAKLAAKGVDLDIITACFDESTTESDKVGYMKWDKAKKKKKKEE